MEEPLVRRALEGGESFKIGSDAALRRGATLCKMLFLGSQSCSGLPLRAPKYTAKSCKKLLSRHEQLTRQRACTRVLPSEEKWKSISAASGSRRCCETENSSSGTREACGVSSTWLQLPLKLLEKAAVQLAAVGLSVAILLQAAPAAAEVEIHRFPASSRPEVFAAQRTLLEAWSIVQLNFIDPSFGGHDWDESLAEALTDAYRSASGTPAFKRIEQMISSLGDPYTRIVPPREYADFRIGSEGEVHGVGMLIASDKITGRLMVLTPLDGGPAFRAGVKSGDEVVSIDGHSVHGWDGDKAAHFLRGRTGSSVNVRLARRTSQVPGVAGRPEPPLIYTEYKQVKLQREKLELSPVYSTSLVHDDHKLGYIRLTNFSQKAAADVKRHIKQLERNGAEAYILDLRNNPGGLVRSGLDIARIFLEGPATIFNVSGRDSPSVPAIMQKVVLEDGHAETRRPLAVLVNRNSASASEILAGALRDNNRAAVIGDRTYGKGKIQSVFELDDGSAIFVTVARYKTPLFSEIDQVGIQPDDSCKLGREVPAGLPFDPDAALKVSQALNEDGCVMRAEESLDAMLTQSDDLTAAAPSASPATGT